MRSTEAQLRLRRMSKLSLVRMVQSAKLVIVSTRKPSLTMAEFISNSAISGAPRSGFALVASAGTIPRRKKWQTCTGSLPSLDLSRGFRPRPFCRNRHHDLGKLDTRRGVNSTALAITVRRARPVDGSKHVVLIASRRVTHIFTQKFGANHVFISSSHNELSQLS